MPHSISRLIRRAAARSFCLTKGQRLELVPLECRENPTGVYSGLAFQDFNSNGTFDTAQTLTNTGGGTVSAAVDRGLGGVVVTAFNALGSAGAATTGADGTFSFTPGGAGPYRVEFTSLPAGYNPGPQGTDSRSTVQFLADGGAAAVSTGLVRPADYAQTNPLLATNVYVYGDPVNGANKNQPALVATPYTSGGNTDVGATQPAALAVSVPASRIGTTLGLGWDRQAGNLYNSAYFKRNTGFGPGGTGAIYRIPVPTNATGAYQPPAGSLLYADLNAIFGAGTAGANLHDTADYDTDNGNVGWNAVGTTSLGGMDVSDDGQFVFVMNLADRQLYRVPTTGAVNSTTVQRVSIPLTNPDAAAITAARFRPQDLRPFAVEYHNGQVYVGVVYTAATLATGPGDQAARDELVAAIYVLDPATMAFAGAPVFTTRLNYTRSQAALQASGVASTWEPWRPTYFSTAANAAFGIAPQPMLSGITFDAQGNLTLSLRDRGTDQIGYFNFSIPGNTAQRVEGFTDGDTLRATINAVNNFASGWTLESDGRVANNLTATPATLGAGPQGNNAGPGGGEFYYQDNYLGSHFETSIGGGYQLPGSPDVVTTAMDPGGNIRAGGFSWFSTLTGAKVKSYELYVTNNGNSPGVTFGKANGVGEVVGLVENAPIEIGNRVFRDANRNGIQDPNEAGIDGVTVFLFDASNNLLGTATTANGGIYSFSNATAADTPNAIYGLAGMTANTSYRVVVGSAANYAVGGALNGLNLSPFQADATANGAARDSDAKLATPAAPIGPGNFPTVNLTTPGAGSNNHTFDAGFAPPAYSVAGVIYADANNDGVRQGGEALITQSVALVLSGVDSGGTPITPRTITTTNGTYNFVNLNAGTYTVTEVNQPAGFLDGRDTPGTPFAATGTPANAARAPRDADRIASIVIPVGTPADGTANVGVNYNFGELLAASLGDFVWLDANGNGLQDGGEAGVNGVTVTLTGTDDTGAAITPVSLLTAGNGGYAFTNLRPGTYTVTFGNTAGATTYTRTLQSSTAPGNTPANDSNASAATGAAAAVTLVAGQNDPTIDAGLYLPVSIGDTVFVDSSGDGAQQAGESGIPNVRLFLDSAGLDGVFGTADDVTAAATATTDAAGKYGFTNQSPGKYQVRVDVTTVPASLPTNTTPNTQVTPALASGASDLARDFGFKGSASLGDRVWLDANGDGAQAANGSEPGLPGARVVAQWYGLDNTAGTADDTFTTLTTGADGLYNFTGLAGGQYRVTVDPTTLPANLAQTYDLTGTLDNAALRALGANENATDVDFGYRGTASVGDTVWYDVDGNGAINNQEPTLPGAKVVLTWSGNDNLPGTPDDVSFTATTDGAGKYTFPGLPVVGAGSKYTVTVTPPAGYPTPTFDADGLGTPNQSSLVLGPTENNVLQDFGYRGTPNTGLGDFVWEDKNGNGKQDAGEPGIQGVLVSLFNADQSRLLATTTTDAGGIYGFAGLAPSGVFGDYVVKFARPVGFVFTTKNSPAATDPNNSDADATTGVTKGYTVVLGATNNDVDAGVYRPVSVGDRVWYDTNGDGLQAATNEPGIIGAKVTVTGFGPDGVAGGGDDVVATTLTGADGKWTIGNLPPGTYSATVDPSTALGAPGVTANTTPTTLVAVALSGDAVTIFDFGFNAGPASLGDRVWLDLNKDGAQGAAEPGLVGVPVSVRWFGQDGVSGGGDDVTFPATVTGANGLYLFPSLPLGKFQVTATAPASNLTATYDLDSGVTAPNGSTVAVLSAGDPNRRDVDFGYAGLASVGDRAWVDQNRDNSQQPTEPGIPGVVVELRGAGPDGLIDTADDLLLTATTGANGVYNFTGLPVFGDDATDPYRVRVVSNPAAGLIPVGDLDGFTSANTTDFPLGSTQARADVDFGFDGTAKLSGNVYRDDNNDGVLDPGEPPIAGVLVTLTGTDALGNPVLDPATGKAYATTTDAAGRYSFDTLTPGTYTVTEAQPAAYNDGRDTAGSLLGAAGNDVISGVVIPATPNASGVNYNFGELGAALSGTVFRDDNGDGVRQPAEPVIPGVLITLIDPATGRTLATATTDAGGNYRFPNLPAGDYRVVETQPPGFGNSPGTPATVRDVRLPLSGLTEQNFGETLGAVSGFVYADYNLDGTRTAAGPRADAPIPGVRVVLTGTDANGPVSRTATTAADGSYLFAALLPGSYTITETQPPPPVTVGDGGFYDARDNLGSLGGTNLVKNQFVLTLGANPDGTAQIGTQYNFGEVPPADPFGFVFADANNNGLFDPGEAPIPGAVVTIGGTVNDVLTGARPLTAADVPGGLTRTTGADGRYEFQPIRPGVYTLTEAQPAGFLDGREQNGDANPPATVVVGNDVFSNVDTAPFQIRGPFNFGEVRPAAVRGTVYADGNGDGRLDPAEARITNAVVSLVGTDDRGAAVNLTATTTAAGTYAFDNLRPGTYRLVEAQPSPYRQGTNAVGSAGGTLGATDVIQAITLTPGALGTDYNFGELLARPNPVPPLGPLPTIAVPPVTPVDPTKRDFLASTNAAVVTTGNVTGRVEPNYAALGTLGGTGGARLSQYLTTASGSNGGLIRAFDLTQGQERYRFRPTPGASLAEGARTATADVNGDGVPDIVVGSGPGLAPRVVIYDGATGAPLQDFLAFEAAFLGGVFVATGDFNGDGQADVIVTPDQGGGPRVRVFASGNPNRQLADFFGIDDPAFRGGARAGAGDFNKDGVADLVVAAGFGGGPRVALFDGRTLASTPTRLVGDFFAFETALRNGVYVTAGDVDGDGFTDLILGAGPGGGPRVTAFSGRSLIAGAGLNPVANFFAGDTSRRGGVNLTAKDLNGDGKVEVITGTAPGELPIVRTFNPLTGQQLDEFYADDANFAGSIYVG